MGAGGGGGISKDRGELSDQKNIWPTAPHATPPRKNKNNITGPRGVMGGGPCTREEGIDGPHSHGDVPCSSFDPLITPFRFSEPPTDHLISSHEIRAMLMLMLREAGGAHSPKVTTPGACSNVLSLFRRITWMWKCGSLEDESMTHSSHRSRMGVTTHRCTRDVRGLSHEEQAQRETPDQAVVLRVSSVVRVGVLKLTTTSKCQSWAGVFHRGYTSSRAP